MPFLSDTIYEQARRYELGNKTVIMYRPACKIVPGEMPPPNVWVGLSATATKQERDSRGQMIRSEPMRFDIDASNVYEAFDKYDASEAKMVGEAMKPKLADAKGILLSSGA